MKKKIKLMQSDFDKGEIAFLLLYLNGYQTDIFDFSVYEAWNNLVIKQYLYYLSARNNDLSLKIIDVLRKDSKTNRRKKKKIERYTINPLLSWKPIIATLILKNHPALQKEIKAIRDRNHIQIVNKLETFQNFADLIKANSQIIEKDIKALFGRWKSLNDDLWYYPIVADVLTNKIVVPCRINQNRIDVVPSNFFPHKKSSQNLEDMPSALEEARDSINMVVKLQKYPSIIMTGMVNLMELKDLIEVNWEKIKRELRSVSDFSDSLPDSKDITLFLIKHYMWQLSSVYHQDVNTIKKEVCDIFDVKDFSYFDQSARDVLFSKTFPIDESNEVRDDFYYRKKIEEHITYINRYYYSLLH